MLFSRNRIQIWIKMALSQFSAVATLSAALLCQFSDAQAAAKPKPDPNSCGATPGLSTPNPARKAILRDVGTKAFVLPNGSTMDLSADLKVMLGTAAAQNSIFRPVDTGTGVPASGSECGKHLELQAAVSTLELNAFELGLSFGYSPSGSTGGGVTSINTKTNLKVGTLALDFQILECDGGTCSVISATTADQNTVEFGLTFEIDFSNIKTGPDLMAKTQLGKIIRSVMETGMKQLSASPKLVDLTWGSTVIESIPEAGIFYFRAGTADHIFPNQTFTVYAVTPSTSICNAYRAVAYAHTTQVTERASTAVIDQLLDPRGVKESDLVTIHRTGTSQ